VRDFLRSLVVSGMRTFLFYYSCATRRDEASRSGFLDEARTATPQGRTTIEGALLSEAAHLMSGGRSLMLDGKENCRMMAIDIFWS
jgi:hypothetical protein